MSVDVALSAVRAAFSKLEEECAARQTTVDLNIRAARARYFANHQPNTWIAVMFNGLLEANGTLNLPEEERESREAAVRRSS